MEEKLPLFLNATHNCYEKYYDIPPTHTSTVLYFYYGELDTRSQYISYRNNQQDATV